MEYRFVLIINARTTKIMFKLLLQKILIKHPFIIESVYKILFENY